MIPLHRFPLFPATTQSGATIMNIGVVADSWACLDAQCKKAGEVSGKLLIGRTNMGGSLRYHWEALHARVLFQRNLIVHLEFKNELVPCLGTSFLEFLAEPRVDSIVDFTKPNWKWFDILEKTQFKSSDEEFRKEYVQIFLSKLEDLQFLEREKSTLISLYRQNESWLCDCLEVADEWKNVEGLDSREMCSTFIEQLLVIHVKLYRQNKEMLRKVTRFCDTMFYYASHRHILILLNAIKKMLESDDLHIYVINRHFGEYLEQASMMTETHPDVSILGKYLEKVLEKKMRDYENGVQ